MTSHNHRQFDTFCKAVKIDKDSNIYFNLIHFFKFVHRYKNIKELYAKKGVLMFEFMICVYVFMAFFALVKSVNDDKEENMRREFREAVKKEQVQVVEEKVVPEEPDDLL